jgi:hypothetical protein
MAGGYQQLHNRGKKQKNQVCLQPVPAIIIKSYQHCFQQLLITLLLNITVSYEHLRDIVHIIQALKVTRGDIFFQGKSIRQTGLIHNKYLDRMGVL